jgi:hypothetical protein
VNVQYPTEVQNPISNLQNPNKLQISNEEKFQTNKKQYKNMPCGIDYEQIEIRFC